MHADYERMIVTMGYKYKNQRRQFLKLSGDGAEMTLSQIVKEVGWELSP